MSNLTLGSLFDGSGGFPLASRELDITPLWASEVEPFPILVTRKNFPNMTHLGDISKLDGSQIEPVDIITFGSPCQDLSIAGKRDGLIGQRSSLFYEAIRIIKEMKGATNGQYPKYIIWENVCGAFSSNKGEDFRCVLEAIVQVQDTKLSIPKPDKWQQAGCIVGEGFSIAWRVLDAQHFGVPQRRKRIFLVADFTGGRAGQILFDEESVPRDFTPSCLKGKETPTSARDSTDATSQLVFENHGQDSRYTGPLDVTPTLATNLGNGGNNQPFVVEENIGNFDVRLTSLNTKNARHKVYETETSRTIDTGGNNPDRNQGGVAVVSVYSTSKNSHHLRASHNQVSTLVASDYKDPPIVNEQYRVRRITPLECGRLQGFPDDWCEGLEIENPNGEELAIWKEVFETHRELTGRKKSKIESQIKKWLASPLNDTAQYKMWGNGVALPCVMFVLSGLKNIAE